jgi:hypothetical protein
MVGVFALSTSSYGIINGFVTPAKVAMTIDSMGLLDTSGNTVWVSQTQTAVTFSAADADFSQASLGTISVAEGRYVGATVSYETSRTITLSGYKYQGINGSQGSDGQYICSSASGYSFQAGASCASPAPFTITVSGGANRTYFPKPICVTTSAKQSSVCQTGDTFFDSGTASNIVFNLMMDLYNAFLIDPSSNASSAVTDQGNLYPIVTFGPPGAAVHLSSHGAGNAAQAELTLLFDNAETLIGTFGFIVGGSTSVPGVCEGTGFAAATAAPAGSLLNSWGLTFIGKYDATNGYTAFITNTGIANASGNGMMLLKDIRKAAGTAISVDCVADSDNTSISAWDSNFSAYLGYTYPSNPGNHAASATITLTKLTDPKSIFGVATCGSGATSGCGQYPQ